MRAGTLRAGGALTGWLLTVNSEGALRLSKRLLTIAVSAATDTVLDGVALTRAALFVAELVSGKSHHENHCANLA